MKRLNTMEHVVKKTMSLKEYILFKKVDGYIKIKTENHFLGGIEVTFGNTEPVIVDSLHEFGFPEKKTIKYEPLKYYRVLITNKGTTNFPDIPEWAFITDEVYPINEKSEGRVYRNAYPIEITETYSIPHHGFEIERIVVVKKESNLQPKRNLIK